jgi:group II intron reverse transcriptase/maturase
MNVTGESDGPILSEKPPNEAQKAKEGVEKRGPAKRNPSQLNTDRTQCRQSVQTALARVRQAAEEDDEQKFTAIFHHVYNLDTLKLAFLDIRKDAASGIDEVTWHDYAQDLERKLVDLSLRLKRGAYRAKPVQRVFIPKADGGQRPIGITALEDKIVQRAMVMVLNAIYEGDFLGFSYGFRPGRSQHQALDALAVGLTRKRINWVLDADIQGFFNSMSHDWIVRFLEHRIADRRVIRHVKKWLNAGVLENGEVKQVDEGCPQGGSVCPLLANIYLHYALDLWTHVWRGRKAQGHVVIVRWADDFIVGFEYYTDAVTFMAELKRRLQKFGLELHPDKTRLLEFGRVAERDRKNRGEGKPETFTFLGFTHCCEKTRAGKFTVKRQTAKKKMRAKLQAIKLELKRRLHRPTPEVGKWLKSILCGHYRYYAVPLNCQALAAFRKAVIRLWKRMIARRSQKAKCPWIRIWRLADRWLPFPRILHPYPSQRFAAMTQGGSPVR